MAATYLQIGGLLWSLHLVASQHLAANQDAYTIEKNGETTYTLSDTALYLHIALWLAQFYGHGVQEGRAPALATNLFYSLLAPFFVTFEFMNGVFGYKENEIKIINERINAYIAEFGGKKRLSCLLEEGVQCLI